MVKLTLELPDGAFAAIKEDPAGFARELRQADAVATEVLRGPKCDAERTDLESGWGIRCSPTSAPETLKEWAIGEGETSVIAVALEKFPSVAILDDAQARRCARTMGVPVMGTLGILFLAERKGGIPSFSDAVALLRANGMFVDEKLISEVNRLREKT
ncbi:MAG TPA: DUF3368 domain-containing protein [Candidatus Brocadiia bacterium]|nr:DUF3368 domain-containing protein [Candidatus Brocadiia bacterium]